MTQLAASRAHGVPSDWYETFFTELPNEFWRRAAPPAAAAEEVDFIERHVGLVPGSRILDVPCGSGRHAIAFAARGHRVLGVDISAEAIAHARRAAASAGVAVDLLQAEMRDLPAMTPVDAAVCLGNSFGYLDLPGTRTLAAALAVAVRPGGGLVIDHSAVAESVLPGLVDGAPREMTVGDITATGSNTYDVRTSCLVSHYVFTRGDERCEVTALHHVHTVAQVSDLLEQAGFVDIELFGGTDDEPYALGGGRLLVVARRA